MTLTEDLDYQKSQKTEFYQIQFYYTIVLKKIRTHTASHGTQLQFDIARSWKSCIACATYRIVTNLLADNYNLNLQVELIPNINFLAYEKTDSKYINV